MMISSVLPRADYPTLESASYLNQASLGLLGQPAVDAMHSFIDRVARHGNRFMSDLEEIAFPHSLRASAASLLKADLEAVAIVGGASELLGQLPQLIQPSRGTKVVLVATDFPAVTRPWLGLAAREDLEPCFVDDDPDVDLTDSLVSALDERTSVLAVSQVQYSTGTSVDIPRLREATRAIGASLVVDVSQAAGAIPVDTGEWAAEAVVCSGYKWLGGHGGVGLAVISSRLLENLPPLLGWMGAPDPFALEAKRLLVAGDARRFTQSTMSYVSMAGLSASLNELVSAGVVRIEEHSRALAERLIRDLAPLGWQPFRDIDHAAASSHIVSIAHVSLPAELAFTRIGEHNVVCSERGGRIRVSLAPYNNEEDVQRFVEALTSCA